MKAGTAVVVVLSCWALPAMAQEGLDSPAVREARFRQSWTAIGRHLELADADRRAFDASKQAAESGSAAPGTDTAVEKVPDLRMSTNAQLL